MAPYLFGLICHLYREVFLDFLNLIPASAVPSTGYSCHIALLCCAVISCLLFCLSSPLLQPKVHETRDVCLFNPSAQSSRWCVVDTWYF